MRPRGIALLGAWLSFLALLAQPPERTVRIKKKIGHMFVDRYEVLRSDTAMKHGRYERRAGGMVITEGAFARGLEEGRWVMRLRTGSIIAQGEMKLGRQVGIWEYFSQLGELVQKVDHDRDSIVFFDVAAEGRAGHLAPPCWPDTSVERRPVFMGGQAFLTRLLMDRIRYPDKDFDQGTGGRVMVEFVVDTLGNTSEVVCITDASPEIKEEACYAVSSLGRRWLPGTMAGRKVKVKYRLPVTFRVQ